MGFSLAYNVREQASRCSYKNSEHYETGGRLVGILNDHHNIKTVIYQVENAATSPAVMFQK